MTESPKKPDIGVASLDESRPGKSVQTVIDDLKKSLEETNRQPFNLQWREGLHGRGWHLVSDDNSIKIGPITSLYSQEVLQRFTDFGEELEKKLKLAENYSCLLCEIIATLNLQRNRELFPEGFLKIIDRWTATYGDIPQGV